MLVVYNNKKKIDDHESKPILEHEYESDVITGKSLQCNKSTEENELS